MKISELRSIQVNFHFSYITVGDAKLVWDVIGRDIVLYNKNYTRHYYDDVTQSSFERLMQVLKVNFQPKNDEEGE